MTLMTRNLMLLGRLSLLVLGLAAGATMAAVIPAATDQIPPPPLPAIRALVLEPAALTLEDARDERRVLVWGQTDDGSRVDLTARAELKADSATVTIAEDGYVRPAAKGEAVVTIAAAGLQAQLPVRVLSAAAPAVGFVREIEPILSKVGCNAGTCHGAAKGKNGFKLSLRGYDPAFDYQALVNDLSGRRFNRVVVEDSLMLLKPTAEVPHEGRQVIKPGSRYYHLLRQWIVEGVKFEDPAQARANRIEIVPGEVELDLPGRTQQLLALAHYPDGRTRDVTREAVFSSSNNDVATVTEGLVTGWRRGEGAILVRYEGNYATVPLSVMGEREGFVWTAPPEYNFIDQHVHAKLRKRKILPSELCTDAEFLRRVSLDLTGLPPTAERVKAFLADSTPSRTKREKVVDELIGSAAFADYWANKWADLLQCNSEHLGQKGVWAFHRWIRDQIAANTPYDQFVRELLLAEGSTYRNPAANYYAVLREPGKITEDVSQTFLGVRFNCAKCHDHPFEKWTQNQYYQFGAFFARLAIKRGPLGSEVIRNQTGDPMRVTGEEIVYVNYNGGEVTHPKTGMNVAPKVPFGEAKDVRDDPERRRAFVEWLTSKDNPLFATAMANRVWSYFFGRGIIDPVDDIRGSNPPSNPALLDALTEHFVSSGFDVRQLMATICKSRTYQLSIRKNHWNEDDDLNFSHALPRRLSAEQMLDAIAVATGTQPKFKDVPAGLRAVELPDGLVKGNDFLALFGRPKRQSACECERTSNVSLAHALNLINGAALGDAVQAPDSRIARLVEGEKDDQKLVEEIYLCCLNRPPTPEEVRAVELPAGAARLEAAQDLAWALMNSPAFLFNR